MMVGIDEMMRISATLAAKAKVPYSFLMSSAMSKMTIPYPMSPTMIPKKSGKKTARTGEGSISRYRGGATSCMIISKGFTHRGLS